MGGQINFEGLKEGRLISKFVATFTLDPPPGTPSHPTASPAAPVELDQKQKWDAFSRSIYASACPSLAIPIVQHSSLSGPACECCPILALQSDPFPYFPFPFHVLAPAYSLRRLFEASMGTASA